jgi:hypothetical protein
MILRRLLRISYAQARGTASHPYPACPYRCGTRSERRIMFDVPIVMPPRLTLPYLVDPPCVGAQVTVA